ncbi:LPXTG cell wall anchor domain-containing protein [Streptomyces griseorubiginosus]|uniref:LPXTG cell wall anchor domain-containing protein n=1 Tax=Streptomyces griseorubiginosus TaxID=67304 RepID=UPI001AD624F4|nr:LPXTG cell wall anchor domain-containing protein [Streptomyces griseorubiginosus]MBO4256677.1 LPXTG cell wall anchor domain-containing protein [Streptomyces griseorubiginosus]
MRTLTRAGALSAVAAAALFAAPVAAHATPVAAGPGDNGTVKIHDARTGEELKRNEPHVCTFYLDAFGFDGVQKVDWHIEAWAPTAASKGTTVKTGDITLDAQGHGRTEDLSLPDGHYKLFWNFDGEKGAAKHKVFWTDCEDEGAGGSTPTSTSTPAPSSSASASASPSDGASAAPSPSSSEAGSVSASSSPSAQGGSDSGDLAETGNGVPVGLLSGAAAALVAGGGYLVVRRRRA